MLLVQGHIELCFVNMRIIILRFRVIVQAVAYLAPKLLYEFNPILLKTDFPLFI